MRPYRRFLGTLPESIGSDDIRWVRSVAFLSTGKDEIGISKDSSDGQPQATTCSLLLKLGRNSRRAFPISEGTFDHLVKLLPVKPLAVAMRGRKLVAAIHKDSSEEDHWVVESTYRAEKGEPLSLLEVDFPTKKAALRFRVPDWFGSEVTGDPEYDSKALWDRLAFATAPAESPSLPPVHNTPTESAGVRHNALGDTYSVKLVYPGFYLGLHLEEPGCVVSFPAIKERLAKRIQPGHLLFIYVTSPERRVIGLAQVSERAEFLPERDYKRPWALKLQWVIGPRSPGVTFSEIGLQVRARVGDSTYSLTEELAAALITRLQDMPELDAAGLEVLRTKYRMFA